MAKGKLILICQSGGDFVKNADGSLTYSGGEAQAVNVNSETVFDDLKLKLAEMCNLEYKTVIFKYFLPGNTRTLITLSNGKDLKRMLDFHRNSVTAEVFAIGKEGFDQEALNIYTGRGTGVKVAESVNRATAAATSSPVDAASPAGTSAGRLATRRTAAPKKATPVSTRKTAKAKKATPTPKKATPASRVSNRRTATLKKATPSPKKGTPKATHSAMGVDASATSPPSKNTTSDASEYADSDSDGDSSGAHADSDNSSDTPFTLAAKKTARGTMQIGKIASPADSVKKRRRTASWKIGVNGPTIVAFSDDDGDKRSRKKYSRMVPGKGNFAISQLTKSGDMPLEKLIALWKEGITGIGQEFKDVYEFRDALQKYAIAHRFTYRVKKNDSTCVSCRCVAESCSWKIHAAWVSAAQSFRIKKFDNTHICEGQAHPAKNWLVNIIKDRLRDFPHQKPKEIVNGILRDFGIELTYTNVWRGIVDAREDIQGSYKEAYDQLPGYCEKIMETNPGSFAKLVLDDKNRFQCLFIAFRASIHGFQKGCRPLLFLESTSLNSKYHEVLLTATALDGNDGFLPVAFAIVDFENDDKWLWFLEELKSALPYSGSMTLVSDREKGLKESVLEVFENAYYGYSIYHLFESFRKSVNGPFHREGKGSLRGLFLAAAHAVRLVGFKKFVEQIKQICSEAYDWVVQIEPKHWTTASFKGEQYNYITENVTDSYINLLEEARDLPITQKIDALISMVMELISARQMDSNEWSTKLTPSKMEKLREENVNAHGLKVFTSSDTLFEVHEDASNTHVVNLKNWDCTCLGWKITRLPCSHAIAVFNYSRKNLFEYCSEYYTVDRFRLTYSESINPVPVGSSPAEEGEATSDSVHVLPPCPARSLSHRRQDTPKEEDQLQE
ncbi:Protein FAR1-RELATED SEQUENCE like [Actinidia chinensis var. chinensis]|uniref:Protein FAR1-RELATED SEQUENCE like n=1 Tax=Actinidia chinensis var. chinensis TaxID=1590841 RepID=A0A2R6S1F9_ACTCC|nr:Protein FAR1-RELATED SEQUENCE like [Actinidia chinensis var. chinensis]